jgi:hypothetical protein
MAPMMSLPIFAARPLETMGVFPRIGQYCPDSAQSRQYPPFRRGKHGAWQRKICHVPLCLARGKHGYRAFS